MISAGTTLWTYLSENERILAGDGAFLVRDSENHTDEEPTDYSYLVFPFAKLYEGFLKDLFLDLSIISKRDYGSNHFRIGKVLSPNLVRRLGGRSAYGVITNRFGHDIADTLWYTWKEGRNLTFHYFPNALRVLSRAEALTIIDTIQQTMEMVIGKTGAFQARKEAKRA